LLSRHCAQTLTSGDGAEPGSGQKLALRYVLAVTEYLQQPRVNQFLAQVTELKNQLHEAIQGLLSGVMPGHDLAALDDLLTAAVSKADLLQQPLGNLDQRALDKPRLQQLIAHAQGLEKLLWQLDQGQQGLGRARCGLLLASSRVARWAAQWPDNPFQVPVTVDNSGRFTRKNLALHRLLKGWAYRSVGASGAGATACPLYGADCFKPY
jgi:DNA-binding transcriptional regulator YbjK